MRSSEWIQSGFAIILAAAAWIRPLTARRRWITTLLAAYVVGALGAVGCLARVLDPFPLSVIRDWLPIVLLFVPYWQTGQFFMGPDRKIQDWLMESDRRWLTRVAPVTGRLSAGVRLSMEFAYTFCYPLVPLGLGVLYVAGLRRYADTYWFVVLVSTYLCYATTLFVPALPPRSVGGYEELIALAPSKGRSFNHWLQRWGSIQAISFPSAHVASTMAASLMVLWFVPLAGVVFLAISVWIGVAAFVGRYHYALDVLLGAVVALALFLAWASHLIPNSFIATPATVLAAMR
jgi:hypothetical protein